MKILLASYGAAHVRMITPLLPRLREAGHEPIALALTTATYEYGKWGIPCLRITDYVEARDPEIRKYAEPLLAKHHNPASGISLEESTAYLGACMRDLVQQLGEEEAQKRYQSLGLNAFEPLGLAADIIQKSGAGAVVSTCSPRLESALLRAAVAQGIPSFCLMALFPLVGMRYLSRADNGQYIFVGNEHFKQQLIANGRPQESIRIIGNPAMDLLVSKNPAARRSKLREARGLKDNDTVILWAEQPEPDPLSPWPKQVRSEVGELRHLSATYKPMIRLHPSSQIGESENAPDGVLVSTRTEDVADALLTSDIVITATSTLGYEAALMEKDVIIVKGSAYDHLADYAPEQGFLVVQDKREIPQAVKLLAEDSPERRALRAARAKLPGPGNFAADTVTEIIRLINNP